LVSFDISGCFRAHGVSVHQAEDGQYYQISEGCIPRFTST